MGICLHFSIKTIKNAYLFNFKSYNLYTLKGTASANSKFTYMSKNVVKFSYLQNFNCTQHRRIIVIIQKIFPSFELGFIFTDNKLKKIQNKTKMKN